MPSTTAIKRIEEIGPYHVLEDLGPAPFGTAYLALDTRSDRMAVLKVIPPSRPGLWEDSASWEILLAETEALGRIYHHGLPSLLEIDELEGSLLIAFTYVEGRTLRELLAQGERPDRATLVEWGCQLLDALAEAHAQGILHRHLAEGEVIVTPEGRLVLTGFGLTQLVFHRQAAAPPEQLAGELDTPQSDLYAVGCLLRRLAFAGGAYGSHAGRRRLGARDPLLKVLARATSLDPEARYESAGEMAEALREAGRGETAPVLRQREVDAVPETGPLGRVAIFPQRFQKPPQPSAAQPDPSSGAQEEEGQRDLWRALVFLVASLLLMSFILTTGWLLLGDGGSRPGAKPTVRSQSPVRPLGRPPAFR
ncbi:MAG TPA: serine/threonine-protein kinase [Thermoanaerobaculia bacterium]|jgi:serine/threonine-protein kinase|nr:serine/threonine-protein kinase [Thermoanaerobaculia bacterium]